MKIQNTHYVQVSKRSQYVYKPSRVLAAILVFLMGSQTALAGNILRKAGAYQNGSPDPTAAAQAAIQATAQAQTAAQAAADQAASPLRRALDSIKQFQAAQDAARQAAQAQPTNVPNGLTPGGLEVGQGITFDPTTNTTNSPDWQGANGPTWTTNGQLTQVTIEQQQQKAILTWKTFNIGPSTDLYFDQKTNGGALANQWIAVTGCSIHPRNRVKYWAVSARTDKYTSSTATALSSAALPR